MIKGKKSFGIIVISITEITLGSYGVFLACRIIISISKISRDLTPYWTNEFRYSIPTAIVSFFLALLMIFLGISLFKKKPFIRILHIVLSPIVAISIVNFLWVFVAQLIVSLNFFVLANMNEMLLIAITLIIITSGYAYYFTRPKVKEQFRT